MGKFFKQAHILVTGPSGAGKSTMARKVSEERGLPLISLDSYPEWKSYEANKATQSYDDVAQVLINKGLAEPEFSVIEGQQFMKLQKVPKDHEFIVVDPGKEQVIKQRVERSKRKAEQSGEVVDAEFMSKKEQAAAELYDLAKKDLIRLGY